jgi:thiosulfate/3-mercaptopyruvate sulfurtransferase
VALAACSASAVDPDPLDEPDPDDPSLAIASCEGCHKDYEALKTLHTPDSIIPTGGCSGPPPYIEPYDRVYLAAAGFADFKASKHGELACTQCHGGVDKTADKEVAHSGTFVNQPSFKALDTCEGCHAEIVTGFENSIHMNGWGQKNSQILRAGVQSFDQLHQGIQTGYEQNCATCHASCGSCHVNRPAAGGGGLMNGHDFSPPDMRDNCTACHSSRGGHAYYGVGTGTKPDIHLTKAGFACMDCHSTREMHASDGKIYANRYQVEDLPECTDCHKDVAETNPYHTTHVGDFNCNVCHSQDYNTCGSCHVAGEGARIHSHQSFKIGINPMTKEKPYKFSTVRRTLAAPDSWSVFGVADLPNFDAKPIYNYTSPHNIQRWTTRTEIVGFGACYSSCHITYELGTYKNRNLYLFSSDFLTEWERNATKSVVVDGKLPRSWGNP